MLVKQANATAAINASAEFYDEIETELRWVAEMSIDWVLQKITYWILATDLDYSHENLLHDVITSKYAAWLPVLLFTDEYKVRDPKISRLK